MRSRIITRSISHRIGLTLIELLLVIGIIALLAGITWTVFASVRGKGREVVCRNNLRVLYNALQMYRHDWGGINPGKGSYLTCPQLALIPYCNYVPSLMAYGAARANMICPSDTSIAGKPWWEPEPGKYSCYISYPDGWWSTHKDRDERARYYPPFPSVVAQRGMELPLWYCFWHALERGEYPRRRVFVIRLNGQLQVVSKTCDMEMWEL